MRLSYVRERRPKGWNVYRNIGQRIIYWLGQKVLVYDIWPNELLIDSNPRQRKLFKASKLDTMHHTSGRLCNFGEESNRWKITKEIAESRIMMTTDSARWIYRIFGPVD